MELLCVLSGVIENSCRAKCLLRIQFKCRTFIIVLFNICVNKVINFWRKKTTGSVRTVSLGIFSVFLKILRVFFLLKKFP